MTFKAKRIKPVAPELSPDPTEAVAGVESRAEAQQPSLAVQNRNANPIPAGHLP